MSFSAASSPPDSKKKGEGQEGLLFRLRNAFARSSARVLRRLQKNLWLDAGEAPSVWAYGAHLSVLAAVPLFILGTAVLVRLAPEVGPWARLAPATAALMLEAAVGLYLLERVMSLLYGWPIAHKVLGRSFFARHPTITLGVATLIHLATAISREALILFRDPLSPLWLQALAVVLVLATALPAWLIVFHPLRFFRASDTVRPPSSSPGQRLTDAWWRFRVRVGELWEDVLRPLLQEARDRWGSRGGKGGADV